MNVENIKNIKNDGNVMFYKLMREELHVPNIFLASSFKTTSFNSLKIIEMSPIYEYSDNAIYVMVDRFSKMAYFAPTHNRTTAQETASLFFELVVKHHGVPKDIVSNRDSKFTSKFWKALWKKMGMELKMSTAFRPQTDGQTERVNSVLNQYLRNYVNADQ